MDDWYFGIIFADYILIGPITVQVDQRWRETSQTTYLSRGYTASRNGSCLDRRQLIRQVGRESSPNSPTVWPPSPSNIIRQWSSCQESIRYCFSAVKTITRPITRHSFSTPARYDRHEKIISDIFLRPSRYRCGIGTRHMYNSVLSKRDRHHRIECTVQLLDISVGRRGKMVLGRCSHNRNTSKNTSPCDPLFFFHASSFHYRHTHRHIETHTQSQIRDHFKSKEYNQEGERVWENFSPRRFRKNPRRYTTRYT